ncbi:hypothetical protein [Nonomuraea sp. NPDC049646]
MNVITPPTGLAADFLRAYLDTVEQVTAIIGDRNQAAELVLHHLYDR